MAYAFSRGETPQSRSGDLAFGVIPRKPLLAVWSAEFHWRPTAALLREKPSQFYKLPSSITISRIILKWVGLRSWVTGVARLHARPGFTYLGRAKPDAQKRVRTGHIRGSACPYRLKYSAENMSS